MRIICIGTSHRTTPLAIREKLSLNSDSAQAALRELTDKWPNAEFAILSTCNRTEIYAAREVHTQPREADLHAWLAGTGGVAANQLNEMLYTLADSEAARHLLMVAAGLDSMIQGDNQIVAQIKAAHAAAMRANSSQTTLNELFQRALHAAKQVRTEAPIATDKSSVAVAAADRIYHQLQNLSDLSKTCILAVGAGDMISLALQRLGNLQKEFSNSRDIHTSKLIIANRTPAAAKKLADRFGAETASLDDLPACIAQADVILCATGSSQAVITDDIFDASIAESIAASGHGQNSPSHRRKQLIVDIAVPRDVSPSISTIDGVTLLNIDDLQGENGWPQNARTRAKAEAIIDEHIVEFTEWLRARRAVPTIDALYRQVRIIADRELADARRKLASHADSQQDMEILNRCMRRTINRLMHPLAAHLKQRAQEDEFDASLDLDDLLGTNTSQSD